MKVVTVTPRVKIRAVKLSTASVIMDAKKLVVLLLMESVTLAVLILVAS